MFDRLSVDGRQYAIDALTDAEADAFLEAVLG